MVTDGTPHALWSFIHTAMDFDAEAGLLLRLELVLRQGDKNEYRYRTPWLNAEDVREALHWGDLLNVHTQWSAEIKGKKLPSKRGKDTSVWSAAIHIHVSNHENVAMYIDGGTNSRGQLIQTSINHDSMIKFTNFDVVLWKGLDKVFKLERYSDPYSDTSIVDSARTTLESILTSMERVAVIRGKKRKADDDLNHGFAKRRRELETKLSALNDEEAETRAWRKNEASNEEDTAQTVVSLALA